MTDDSSHILYRIFRLELIASEGTAFQELFTKLMWLSQPEYETVKPQGKVGDQKLDGIISSQGIYFQIYAPEKPELSLSKAIKKLRDSFYVIHAYWSQFHDIRKYIFVFNDKFKGSYPTLYEEMHRLKSDYADIAFEWWSANKCLEIFRNLSFEKQKNLIGYMPTPYLIANVAFDALRNVIQHICRETPDIYRTQTFDLEEFHRKIVFNQLSKPLARYLDNASYQGYIMDDYFKFNNISTTKDDISNRLSQIYKRAKQDPEIETSDDLFLYLLHFEMPGRVDRAHFEASLVVMAYYFEHCDIFEVPPKC